MLLTRVLGILFGGLLMLEGIQVVRLGIEQLPPAQDDLTARYFFFLFNMLLASVFVLAAIVLLRKASSPANRVSGLQKGIVVLSSILNLALSIYYLDGFDPKLYGAALFVLLASASVGGIVIVFLSTQRNGAPGPPVSRIARNV